MDGKASLVLESRGLAISIINYLYCLNCALTSALVLYSFSILDCIVDIAATKVAISPHLVYLPKFIVDT